MPVYRRPVLQAQRLGTPRHGSAGRRAALRWEVGEGWGGRHQQGLGTKGKTWAFILTAGPRKGLKRGSDLQII